MAALVQLACGDAPDAWAALGFAVADGAVRIGPVTVRCDGAGGGLRSWTLAGSGPDEVAGIATDWDASPGTEEPGEWPFDHLVVLTDSRDRTAEALVGVGGDERGRAEPPKVPIPMSFVRMGETIVEVAEGGGPPRLWGLVAVVPDFSDLPAELVTAPKDAVQRGRQIVRVREEAGLGTEVAFMTPRVRTR